MRIENLVVNCTARYPRTCRRTPFEVVVYELNYSSEDKELMDLLRTKAEELARQVNPGAANNSMHERSPERILADCEEKGHSTSFFTGPVVYIVTDGQNLFYDDQVIEVPKGKKAMQIGTFRYETKLGEKVVPVIKFQ